MLPFEFPLLFWKLMANESVTGEDLRSVDSSVANMVWNLRHLDSQVGWDGKTKAAVRTDEEFAVAYPLTFTAKLASGEVVELLPGGKDVRVSRSNARDYCNLLEQCLLHQFDAHIEAIRRGLGNMVPLTGLALFTGRELEVLVCGRPDVDVANLRANTMYEGWSDSEPYINMFWRVFASLSPAERSGWLRFAYGRTRLPPPGEPWPRKHKLSKKSGGDGTLPMAHACFFHVELPQASTEDKLRRMLLICVYEGSRGVGAF